MNPKIRARDDMTTVSFVDGESRRKELEKVVPLARRGRGGKKAGSFRPPSSTRLVAKGRKRGGAVTGGKQRFAAEVSLRRERKQKEAIKAVAVQRQRRADRRALVRPDPAPPPPAPAPPASSAKRGRKGRGSRQMFVFPENHSQRIEASLASIPSRAGNLPRVIGSLFSQVDVVLVYLNGYPKAPDCVKQRRVEYAMSQDHGDRGDAGKFFWSDKGEGYQLTCDDDLLYPKGYAAHLVSYVNKLGCKAAVGLHGIIIDSKMVSFYRIGRSNHWRMPDNQIRQANVLGTGVLAYHSSTLEVKPSDFELPNMADIWFALLCQRQFVPCATAPRSRDWLKMLPTPFTIYDKHHNKDEVQTKMVKRVWPWRLFPLPQVMIQGGKQ
jgi:hypothetical protein